MKKGKKIILCILCCFAVILSASAVLALKLITPTVTFDFSSQSALTGRASGFLYGFAEDDIPTMEIAESIGINSLATKTAGGLQHPIGDVRDVSDTFLSAGGEMLMVYTQDMYDTWYYQLDSLEAYNERVKTTVTEMENSSYRDSLVYCIYNEMDNGAWLGNFWEEENRYKFYDAWKETYGIVKEINPDAKIAGPGYCGYNYDFIKEFLSYCKENDCLPEIMVWHELSDQSIYRMESNFRGYYSMCEELGLERMPVCISEYGLMSTNGIPGESVKWLARLEKQDAYGCVAYWRLANNLSDTVADDVTPNGNYWVYNFYGKMKGAELSSSERDILHSNVGKYLKGIDPLMNKGFIALASYDGTEEKFYVLAGGSSTDSNIKIENLGDAFNDGDKLTVKISYVDYKGLGGAVNAPTVAEIKNITVRGGSISFTLPCERESQAFFVEIEKGEAQSYKNEIKTVRYEAEAQKNDGAFVEGGAYALSGGLCVKNISSETAPFVFRVNEKSGGIYRLDLVYGNINTDGGERISAALKITAGTNECIVKCPSSIKPDCMECVSLDIKLQEDKEIKLEVLTEGCLISLDFIDLTPVTEEKVYVSCLTSRNTKEENAYFAVIPADGYYKLSDLTDDSLVTINGNEIEGDGDGIFWFGRGYNKIVLPEGVSLSGAERADIKISGFDVYTPSETAVIGAAQISPDENTSSGEKFGWISSDTESGLSLSYKAPHSGYYAFTVEYANSEQGGYHDYNVDLVERYISIFVDGEKQGNYFFRSTYSWDYYKTKTVVLYLDAGEHIIEFTNDGSYSFNNKVTYAPDIGSITVIPVK